MEMEEFYASVGEILMYSQCIEHDIKRIYAFLIDGGFEKNMIRIEEERWTLGQVVHELHDFDQTLDEPFFTPNDYALLNDIVRIRNYYAHQVYLSFCYLTDENDFERSFSSECRRVSADKERLSVLYEVVEDTRVKLLSNDPLARY